jgi:hypothetical protein
MQKQAIDIAVVGHEVPHKQREAPNKSIIFFYGPHHQ